MTKNEGTVDRVIRLIIAVVAAIIAVAVGSGSVGGIILWVVAALMAVTSATGFCVLYKLVGASTCPRQ